MEENPPYFCFLREEGAEEYEIRVTDGEGRPVWSAVTGKNYAVPDLPWESGSYRWNLLAGKERRERGWWEFTLSPGAVRFGRPAAGEVWDSVPDRRPRQLFFSEDIPAILRDRQPELETLKRNIALALSRPLPQPPAFHRDPAAPGYREYFGSYREYCDRDMVACALGYALLGDLEAGEKARRLLLEACGWNPFGPCSLECPWGDEIGLSNARCLPSVYDLIYPLLTREQRYLAERTIWAYALQCRRRLERLDFAAHPGNSHSGRIPAYLGRRRWSSRGSEFADQEPLRGWLEQALEIYGSFFPFFGTPDGAGRRGRFTPVPISSGICPFSWRWSGSRVTGFWTGPFISG